MATTRPIPLEDRPAWEEFTAARDRFFAVLADLAELAERAEEPDEARLTGPAHRSA